MVWEGVKFISFKGKTLQEKPLYIHTLIHHMLSFRLKKTTKIHIFVSFLVYISVLDIVVSFDQIYSKICELVILTPLVKI